MITVNIEYHPFRWLKFRRLLKGIFPQTMAEISPGQLIAVARLLKGSVSDAGFLHTMTGIKKRIIGRLDGFQRYNLMELFTIFNNIAPFHDFIIKTIACGNQTLVAPQPRLKGVTFGQFIFGDSYFDNYHETANPEELRKFVASFYIPEGVKFDEPLIESGAALLKKTDPLLPEAIAINYGLLREWLCTVYPMIFVKQEVKGPSKNEGEQEKPKARRDPNSWVKVFENLVGDDIVNYDKYAQLPVHNVFRFLTRRIKDSIKANKKK